MRRSLPLQDAALPFCDTLPPYARDLLWLPRMIVTLTLPDLAGHYTAFEVRVSPWKRLVAYNVVGFVSPEPGGGGASKTVLQ